MFKKTGLGEFQRKLNDMAHRTESVSRNHSVPLPELLTPDFLRRCSRFQSAEEMFEASGFKVESAEDFAAIPDAEWDEFVRAHTSFPSWEAMLGKAGGEWATRRLKF